MTIAPERPSFVASPSEMSPAVSAPVAEATASTDDYVRLAYTAGSPDIAVAAIEHIADIDHARRLQAYNDIYATYAANMRPEDRYALQAVIREDAYQLISRHLGLTTVQTLDLPSSLYDDAGIAPITDYRDLIALAQVWETTDRDPVITTAFPSMIDAFETCNPGANQREAATFRLAYARSLENGQTIDENRYDIIGIPEQMSPSAEMERRLQEREQEILAEAKRRDEKRRAAVAARLSHRALDDTVSVSLTTR